MMLLLHIGGATVALLSGTLALIAAKGGWLHRRSGTVFVYSMLAMSGSGAVLGALQPNAANVIAGVLTFYLVLTARLAVRRPVLQVERVDALVAVIAVSVTVGAAACAFVAAASAPGRLGGIPAGGYLVFGTVALLATIGDARLLWRRRLEGAPRLVRHLWRMCFAFWIATASFFLGPPRRLPPLLRHSPLRPLPVLLVLVVMLYWLARVSFGRRGSRLAAPVSPGSMRTAP